MELSLAEFMARPGMTQTKAGQLLGRTQGGIRYMLQDTLAGKRNVWVLLDDCGEPIGLRSETVHPVPPAQPAVESDGLAA